MFINGFGVCLSWVDVDITDGDTGGFVDKNTIHIIHYKTYTVILESLSVSA